MHECCLQRPYNTHPIIEIHECVIYMMHECACRGRQYSPRYEPVAATAAAATLVAAAAVAAEKCSKATSTAWYPPAHPLVL